MAKIKISGYAEFIEVSQEKGKQIYKVFTDDSIASDEKINISDRLAIKKGDVKMVLLEEQRVEDTSYSQHFEEYKQKRDSLLALTARQRAEKSSFGHFKLFYWSVYKHQADTAEWKEKVIEAATKFYQENPYWTVPSMRLWRELLGLSTDFSVSTMGFQALSRVESNEIEEVEKSQKFFEGQVA